MRDPSLTSLKCPGSETRQSPSYKESLPPPPRGTTREGRTIAKTHPIVARYVPEEFSDHSWLPTPSTVNALEVAAVNSELGSLAPFAQEGCR
jgi:hypothetical protein